MAQKTAAETLQDKRKSADELITEVLQKIPEENKPEILRLIGFAEVIFTSQNIAT